DAAYVDWVINEAEAAVIRRIFECVAHGVSQATVAKQLNAEGAPTPNAQRGRPRGWNRSSIHEALHRRRYRGEVIYGQTQKRNQWGECCPSHRPEDEWLIVHREDLRLVPEELWQAAHARIAKARSTTNLYRRRGANSRYLLVGLA